MQAIILASGRGSRFGPLTLRHPKPLLPVANRPLLDYLLSAATKAGFTEIFVTIGHAGDQVQSYLDQHANSYPVIPVPAPNWEQGPLASLQPVLPRLSPNVPCVLLPADLYISTSHLRLLTTSSLEVALLYDPLTTRPGTLLQLNASNHVQTLTRSPTPLPAHHPSLPALRTTPRFFKQTLTTGQNLPLTVYDLLQRWLAQGQLLHGIPITDGLWCDVDTVAHLIALNYMFLTTRWPSPPFPPGTYLQSHTSLKGPLQSAALILGHNTSLEGPVLVGTGVMIGDDCVIREGTCLGASTTILPNSTLARCITFPHSQVPPNTDLTAAVIDEQGNVFH